MRQNILIALLSVVATLLLVLVLQNFLGPTPVVLGQIGGGGTAAVGTIGVGTGPIQGADANGFWIYEPARQKLLVYLLGPNNKLEFRAGRDIQYDMQVEEYAMTGGKSHTVEQIKDAVNKLQKKK
ncbi:MAG: hypothetical protein HY717_12270 [Planctomycetes bacterium]|nr:hypothetical protein [Planctomycetota bacterium]